MTDTAYISSFRNNNQALIARFYTQNERVFKHTISSKFKFCDTDLLSDVYQDSVCRLWENIQRGKLSEQTLSTPLFSYLVGIGERVMLETLRKQKENNAEDTDWQQYEGDIAEESINAHQQRERFEIIRETVYQMGAPCAPLLLKFYWEELSMEDIALELHYKNANSAKTQKNKCMNKLKALFRQ